MESTIISTIITFLTTIIGFIISYILIVKQKDLAVQQQKNEWQIEKLAEIAADILDMIKDYELLIAKVDIDARMLGERKKKVNDTIICYGTENVVKIWSYYNHLIYQGLDDKVGVGSVQIIAPLVLLIMQIKYDATDIKTSPKVWYVGFTSQEMLKTEFYNKSIVEINRIVDLLDLPSFFKSTDNSIY